MSIPPAGTPPKPVRALGPALVIILVFFAAGLGYYQLIYYPPHHTATTSISILDPHQVNVTLPPGASIGVDNGYNPDTITVMIGYNATVNWYNNQTGVEHTITANASEGSIDPSFSSWATTTNYIQYGATLQYTFTKAGTFYYFCEIHPLTMKGKVIVLAGSNSTSANVFSSA